MFLQSYCSDLFVLFSQWKSNANIGAKVYVDVPSPNFCALHCITKTGGQILGKIKYKLRPLPNHGKRFCSSSLAASPTMLFVFGFFVKIKENRVTQIWSLVAIFRHFEQQSHAQIRHFGWPKSPFALGML